MANKHELAYHGVYLDWDELIPNKTKCYFCFAIFPTWSFGDNVCAKHLKLSPFCPLLNNQPTNNIPLFEYIPPICYRIFDCKGQVRILLKNQLRSVVHPDFVRITSRVSTFKNWPLKRTYPIKLMAIAGFFYRNYYDSVECYYCGGSISHWETYADPWVKHAEYYPYCLHVLIHKGWEFVISVLSTTGQMILFQELYEGIQAYISLDLKIPNVYLRPLFEKSSNLYIDTLNYMKQNPNNIDFQPANGDSLCILCNVNFTNTIFFPCKHSICCDTCLKYCQSKCPRCEKAVDIISPIYKN